MSTPVAVIGAGAWGTALAILLARNGHRARLWGRDPRAMEAAAAARINAKRLPDHPFPPLLEVIRDVENALDGAVAIVIAVPSSVFRAQLEHCARIHPGAIVISATKGFDPASGRPLHETARSLLPPGAGYAALSGPTFAAEIAAGLPAAVTVAAADEETASRVAALFHGGTFRAYTSTDLIGVEVGGSVKNVLAIAAGIADGLGFGANTRAALIARGLSEMTRFGVALGADPATFTGLAGLGDLVLTCTDDQSRNRRFGLALGAGMDPARALAEIGATVEGRETAVRVRDLAREYAVGMPIVEEVVAVLEGVHAPAAAVGALLARPPGREAGGD